MLASAIIPAYNEEKTVAAVVNCLKEVPSVAEVVVVSDGSTDLTASVASRAGAMVIELERNIGKAGAILLGSRQAQEEILLLLDADLLNLHPSHIECLLKPVSRNEADMSVGIFSQGRLLGDLAQYLAPFLTGQRVVHRSLLNKAASRLDIAKNPFGLEVAITTWAIRTGAIYQVVLLSGVSHRLKEEKLGLLKGLTARFRMYKDIVYCLNS